MKKVAFHNLGCKVNAYETEAMIKQFADHGYSIVDFDEVADIYVINTCSVTAVADKKSRQMLHRAKKLNGDALVVAVGCYSQANPERALSDESVDIVIGNENKSKAFEIIMEKANDCGDISVVKSFDEMQIDGNYSHTRAFVKIQDGCNQFCSYCLIPYLRGRVRSREPEAIFKEVKALYKRGFKEIVLTGIHLSSYGVDGQIGDYKPLLGVIKGVCDIMKGGRVRLGSLEPRLITREFVEEIAKIPNLCPHFHLSLQSGCDETLKRMNRHYTSAQYEEACDILRGAYEHPAITTDVIVGFPGETDEEFETTYEFLKRINLYEMHIFKYSVREGTVAASLPNHVDKSIQEERSNRLLALSEEHKASFSSYYKGKEVEILIEELDEEASKEGKKYYSGYNSEYVRFLVPEGDFSTSEIIKYIP